mgnify:CR=1
MKTLTVIYIVLLILNLIFGYFHSRQKNYKMSSVHLFAAGFCFSLILL